MWIHIKSKPTVNPEHDWTHTTILSTKQNTDDSFESFPISILITASKEKPLYVMYHIDNGKCDIGPLLFTCYNEAYETLCRKIQIQYKDSKDEIVVFQRFHSSNRISSTMYETEGMKFLSRWNLDTITEMA